MSVDRPTEGQKRAWKQSGVSDRDAYGFNGWGRLSEAKVLGATMCGSVGHLHFRGRGRLQVHRGNGIGGLIVQTGRHGPHGPFD